MPRWRDRPARPARGASAAKQAQYRAEMFLADLGMDPSRHAGRPVRRRDPPRLAGSGAGRRAGRAPARRADQPSRPADHRMAGGAARGFAGSFVVISHDRRFLTRLSTRTWWLDRGILRSSDQGYAGSRPGASRSWPPRRPRSSASTSGSRRRRTGCTAASRARRKRNMGRLRQLHDLRRSGAS